MVTGEIAGFAVLTAIGAGLLGSSFGYGIFLEGMRVGAGFLPMATGLLLTVMAGAQLLRRLAAAYHTRRGTAPGQAPGPATDSTPDENLDLYGRTEKYRVKQLWTVFAALLAAVLLIPLIGFLAAFGLLAVFISTVVEKRSLVSAAAITLVSVGSVYVVFVLLLKIPLLAGSLFAMLGG